MSCICKTSHTASASVLYVLIQDKGNKCDKWSIYARTLTNNKVMCNYASSDIVTSQQTPRIYSNSMFFNTFPRIGTSVLLSHRADLFLIRRLL